MAAHTPTHSEEAALSLTMAVVASSPGPLLLLDGDLNIVAASASFSDAFDLDLAEAPGRPLSSLGAGEWNRPQLRALLKATASGAAKIEAFEMDLERPGRDVRRLVVHAQRLVYLDMENLRLLMAVTDLTDTRADERLKDDALRQNLVLLQEVRHRVANSLQIIASVLLQNAKRTRSDETRSHLKDAHHRVMSVAALERQLAETGNGPVQLLTYFTNLCDSIAASMIADPGQLSLSVTGAGGVVDPRTSVSLGLIVTELVINALKHAFPDDRGGKIVVDCEFRGANWTLSVADDGVGMPNNPAHIRMGLGSSIVQALAAQLEATVDVAPARPGTRVSIIHTAIALVADRDDAVGGAAAALGQPAA
ncbi:MAG TPA: histidine kinase dimerization/phosphoacceptor domain -containing protein [Phenylobacterium sp.]|jgi:two-component sensor histidine kinase|uniref:sensor histidine kinase n=1 Tax=Phenylobacterium sp. TaxID=1871053 RepID=UPI002C98830B|nr:histidine kinase dimerization/phosphoacceptor domain -containing protein [Phenylobacterium sp.]HXA39015.1 histidine kinase dimerization/phosphoacceptor domain -containing protein [Phenylobacterium sp.]